MTHLWRETTRNEDGTTTVSYYTTYAPPICNEEQIEAFMAAYGNGPLFNPCTIYDPGTVFLTPIEAGIAGIRAAEQMRAGQRNSTHEYGGRITGSMALGFTFSAPVRGSLPGTIDLVLLSTDVGWYHLHNRGHGILLSDIDRGVIDNFTDQTGNDDFISILGSVDDNYISSWIGRNDYRSFGKKGGQSIMFGRVAFILTIVICAPSCAHGQDSVERILVRSHSYSPLNLESVQFSGTADNIDVTAELLLQESEDNKYLYTSIIIDGDHKATYRLLLRDDIYDVDLMTARLLFSARENSAYETILSVRFGEPTDCFVNDDGRSSLDIYFRQDDAPVAVLNILENCEITSKSYE